MMPFPRIRLFRRAHASVSSVEYLYAVVRADGRVRGIVAYTPNLRRDEQLVRFRVEGP